MAQARHLKRAREAVDEFLRANAHHPTLALFQVSVIADQAARDAGRKGDLFEHLSAYEAVLPPGAEIGWQAQGTRAPLVLSNLYPAALEAPHPEASQSLPTA